MLLHSSNQSKLKIGNFSSFLPLTESSLLLLHYQRRYPTCLNDFVLLLCEEALLPH